MFNKIFNKNEKVVLSLYRVTFADGSIVEMDSAALNMAVAHDYDDEIINVEKIG